jgi:hypothetical protein
LLLVLVFVLSLLLAVDINIAIVFRISVNGVVALCEDGVGMVQRERRDGEGGKGRE